MPKTKPGLDDSHDDRDFFFNDIADAFVFETPNNANSGATPQLASLPNTFSATAVEVTSAASSAPASSHAFLNTPALLSSGVLTASDGAAVQNTAAAAAFNLANAEMKSGALSVFDNQLAALYYEASAQSAQMSAFTSTVQHNAGSLNVVDGVQYVTIDAIAKDGNGAALLGQLKEAGLQSGSSFGTIASGLMDVSKVGDLLGIADLAFARESAMMTNAGAVTTQADTAQHADTARTNFHVTGAGVKIGVLSDSFNLTNPATTSYPGGDNMASNIAGNDLPANTTILQESAAGGADEGRGMAQLIHDLAPGASIQFASAFNGFASFASNIVALANAGAKIIVDDVQYFAELAYQEDAISQAVDQAAALGATYFSAAGNEGARGYEGTWVDGGAQTIGTVQGGSISEHFMQFAPGQNYMTINLQFVDHIVLEWDRPANSASGPSPGAGNDLDLFITNAAGDRIFQQATSVNTNADPVEVISLTGLAANQLTGTNYLRVGLFSGTAPTEIRVIAYKNDLGNNLASNFNTGTIYGHAASPNAIGVAAAAFSQTPAFGVDPAVVESFSSGGPSTYWYDVNGNRLSSALVSHSPQITAVDGGNTTFFGSDSGTDPDTFPNFFGTSAAAPDAAAIAALVLEAQPGLTHSGVLSVLMGSALDMDDPGTPGFDTGFDNRTGAGLVQADRALTIVHPGSLFTPAKSQLAAFAPDVGGWNSDNQYPRELADVNHDGMADIVGFGQSGVYVALATGGGAFGTPTFKLAAFAPDAGGWNSDDRYPRELADVNHDGFADIVGFGQSGVYVALATGGGSFGTPTFKLAAFAPDVGGWNSDNQYPRELADVNGDGFADIVGFGQSGVYVSLATGGGSFGTPTFKLAAFAPDAGGWNSQDRYPRHLADVNHDGMADIVGFGEDGVYVALATGGGNFGTPSFKFAAFAPSAGGWNSNDRYPRELADVNHDGMADIVGFGEAGVYVSLATGDGNFAAALLDLQAFAPSAGGWNSDNLYPRQLADINHDGVADIVGFGQSGVYEALNGFHFT